MEIREEYREDKTETVCIWVWRWSDPCEVLSLRWCPILVSSIESIWYIKWLINSKMIFRWSAGFNILFGYQIHLCSGIKSISIWILNPSLFGYSINVGWNIILPVHVFKSMLVCWKFLACFPIWDLKGNAYSFLGSVLQW